MKTLYIDINEEITTIVGKIKKVRSHNIVLVVPNKAQLFQSIINLKILKKNASESEKKIEIFTTDEKGKALCQKQGIDLYEGSLTSMSGAKAVHIDILPKQKGSSPIKRTTLTNLIKAEQQKTKLTNVLSKPQTIKQQQEKKAWSTNFLLATLRKKTTFAFLTLSIIVLFLVSYIALPSATIYITPASNVVEKTVNITLADRQLEKALLRETGRNSIPSFTIETVFEQNLTYKVQGKVFTGTNSECELTIFNQRPTPWTLIEQTRFQSPEGIIFRIAEQVEVPGGSLELVVNTEGKQEAKKTPGTLIVRATADQESAQGEIVGAKGNLIPKTPFILPALTEENQGLISALNTKACVGGLTASYSIVKEEDKEAATKKMEQQLSKGAKEFLADFVEANNLKNNTSLVLFDDPQVIKEEVLAITLPENIVDTKTDEFAVNGRMKIQGVAYNKEDYFTILDEELLQKVHPQKRLASIDRNSITYTIVYSDSELSNLSRVKLSVTIKGVEEYTFDVGSEQGQQLIQKIVDAVPGKNVQEAIFFISNFEEIQKANISVWPFWTNIIPSLKSGISVKVN